MVQAIRRFCDRNGACLLVKARQKMPVPSYLAAVADRCVYDESSYQATILEALSVAQLCISFYSAAVMESIGLGVPHLTVGFPAHYYYDDDNPMNSLARFQQFYDSQEGSLFRFQGAASLMSIPEAIYALPAKTLAGFRLAPESRKAYVAKYLGFDDGVSAGRVLDLVQRGAVGEPRRAAEAAAPT